MPQLKSPSPHAPATSAPTEGRRDFLKTSTALAAATLVPSAMTLAAEGPDRPEKRRTQMIDLTATAAVAAMKSGDIKAEDYATALLARADEAKSLNAFRTLHPQTVLEAAREADRTRAAGRPLGALHGLLIPVKDSVNTKALPTSNGTRALRDFRPRDDAAVLKPLFAQGALLMGKTNLHELSCGWTSNNATFGAVLNPYDPTRTPGGSSGGSAAAVAARVAPLAIAEDTYGSIRVPATFCGLAGLRPTFGRYPGSGVMALGLDKFDQVGPLARSVRDLALFDTVVTGARDTLEPLALKNVRIAVSPKFHAAEIDPEVDRIIRNALQRIESAGATIVHAELPAEALRASDLVREILGFELLESFTRFLREQNTGVSLDQLISQAGPNLAPLLVASRNPGPRENYNALLRELAQIEVAIHGFYRTHRVDAVAFATSVTPAFAQGDAGSVKVNGREMNLFTAIGRNVGPASCARLSCLVLPAGITASGLPVGLELDGMPGTDRRMLALGLAVEDVLGPIRAPVLRA
jgi:indoleacetamide hydrolase